MSRTPQPRTPLSRPRPTTARRTVFTPFFDLVRAVPFRRTRPRLLGGVAAGIAAGTGANVWLVRLGLLVASLLPVIGVGAYVLAWVLLPWEDHTIPAERLLSSGA